jgi:hypothetical protein
MPAQPSYRIRAQHDRAVNHVRADVPKVRDKFRGFAQIGTAEPRSAMVFVDVNMKHADFATKRHLQGFSNGVRAHHRADCVVAQVVGVSHSVKLVSKDNPSTQLQRPYSARQKSDTFRGKWVPAA